MAMILSHLLRGKNAEQANRSVPDYNDSRPRLYIRCVGGEPSRSEYIGNGEKAWKEIVGRNLARRHEGPIRKWHSCV
jgi:hypothetical protein